MIPNLPPPFYPDPVVHTKADTFILPTDVERPAQKPRLLTQFEFDTMWDPDPKTLRLGILLSLNLPSTQREATLVRNAISTIRMAVNEINEEKIIPGLNMSILIRDSQNPSLYTSTGGAAAISAAGKLISAKVGGVIGDIKSDLTKYEALMTSSVLIPQCSFAAGSASLSDQATYPSFYRTIPTIIVLVDALLEVVRSMGWKRISLIYDINTLGWSGREYFSARALKLGIYILVYQPLSTAGVPFDPTYTFIKNRIRSSQSRIQVLIATGDGQFAFLREMKEAGFFGPDYAWVTGNEISSQLRQDPDVKAYDGLIMVDNGWELSGYAPYHEFLSKWLRLNPLDYPGAGNPNLENNEGMAYSCVMMLANAYRDLIEKAIPDPAHRNAQNPLIQRIIAGDQAVNVNGVYNQKTYTGPSGPITLDQNGDRREGYYMTFSMQDGHSVLFGTSFIGNYTFVREPLFKDGQPTPPSDAPPWAIQNPQWDNASGIVLGTLCIIGIVLTIISAVLVVYFRDNIVIKASSPTFCLCELLGILLIMIWCTLHIGIPSMAMCIAQSFILPIGVTLLVGSLTIKNYRIYRIFNSVTVMNQAFQTRLLLRWMALALFLCVVPMIVEMIIDAPRPQMINIRSVQWIRCRGFNRQVWWILSSSIVPVILIFFGVFLAFKTRNVVFLWNEAKQISLVLYNVFFFTIIIVVSQFFPVEIYLATFYISIVGILFVAFLALAVLFAPKFRNIWKNLRKPWEEDLHPSNRIHQRIPGGIGRPGSGGGGGAGILGRMPDDFRTVPPNFVRRQVVPATTTAAVAAAAAELGIVMGMGDDGGNYLGQPSVADHVSTAERVLAPVVDHTLTTGGSNEKPSKHKRTFPVASLTRGGGGGGGGGGGAANANLEGNPLGAWMNSKVPRKGSDPGAAEENSGTFMTLGQRSAGLDEDGGGTSSYPGENEAMNENVDGAGIAEGSRDRHSRMSQGSIRGDNIPKEHHEHNRVEFAENSFGAGEGGTLERHGADLDMGTPLRTAILAERTFGSSMSGAQRMLDCFVFLLPIRALRGGITSLLSHWCMATLILIPEAHAFLSVDSTDGRSTSYLMLSMTQVQDEQEPTIRVTSCHARPLLIRFSSQSRLDGWMSLFSEQDLQSLTPRSSLMSLSGSYPPYASGYNGNLPDLNGGTGGMRRRSVAPDPSSDLTNTRNPSFSNPSSGNGGAGGGGNSDMTMMMNGGGGGGAPGQGGDRGNGLQTSDDENRRRPSWASRLGTGFLGFWNRMNSSNSTSGTSQIAYDGYNDHHAFHDHNSNINNNSVAGNLDVDRFVTPWWSRAGGEWTSTNMPSSGPTERQSRGLIMHQPPFVGASEIVVEDRVGETESSVRDSQTAAAAATTPLQLSSTASEEPSLADGVDASGAAAGGTTAGYDSSNQSVRRGSTASGRVGDSFPPPILCLDPPSGPSSTHAQSLHSYKGSIRSIACSTQPAPEDGDDDDSDDLYDPEFGIGGSGRRRRRNYTKLPNRLLPTQGSQTIIPSAAVISAAAAAVSAGWSESDALAAAMAIPGFTPTPSSASGSWMTPTKPGISSDCSSLRNSRTRHNSRTSTTSSLQASLYPRRGSAGEGYMSSGGSSNSVCSKQGALAASGSATSILATSGAPGSGRYRRRAFNDRIIMSPIITTSISSAVAPLATYSTSAAAMANSPIEPQFQPQQQQDQRPQQ
ncbi:hypothetical protein EC957_009444 [Mortierella hygrophila]|uniref:G-protein coupled receptors family 3 profile domain-containing protein n=1 Tax=Mortierella hygrophila TaxID=979708 RepID=A0A9P6FAB8_9FUNG|nr:hypothetical protein EC957_009444 [Mortierella hygrophila]